MQVDLARRSLAEAVGTGFLLAAVVGSGIMGDRLAGGNVAVALLANTVSTGAALVGMILALGPISGAHFNPAVTIVDAWQGGVRWREVPTLIAAQAAGAFAGVACAHAMFSEPLFSLSLHARSGGAQVFNVGPQRVSAVPAAGDSIRSRRQAVSPRSRQSAPHE